MKIPKYWAKGIQSTQDSRGRKAAFTCWHWSDESLDQAKQKANARAGELAQKLLNNVTLERYPYGDRPLREEILQPITNQAGQEIAVITRNAYGAKVLNAAKAMFIDIDFSPEESGKSQGGPLQRLFGKASWHQGLQNAGRAALPDHQSTV